MQSRFKKTLIIVGAVLGVVIPSCLVTLHYVKASGQSLLGFAGEKRNFQEIPFDSLDASISCEDEAKNKFGDEFLRSTVDWHSTRFQETRNMYIVVLDADIWIRESFEQAKIYCYINPRSYMVSYFKAYDSEDNPMLSSGVSFEEMMDSFKQTSK